MNSRSRLMMLKGRNLEEYSKTQISRHFFVSRQNRGYRADSGLT